MTCDMEASTRERPSYHAGDVEMTESHSVCSFISSFFLHVSYTVVN